jgi:hypothetical protein
VQCLYNNTNDEIAGGQSKRPEIIVTLLKKATKHGLERKMASINC